MPSATSEFDSRVAEAAPASAEAGSHDRAIVILGALGLLYGVGQLGCAWAALRGLGGSAPYLRPAEFRIAVLCAVGLSLISLALLRGREWARWAAQGLLLWAALSVVAQLAALTYLEGAVVSAVLLSAAGIIVIVWLRGRLARWGLDGTWTCDRLGAVLTGALAWGWITAATGWARLAETTARLQPLDMMRTALVAAAGLLLTSSAVALTRRRNAAGPPGSKSPQFRPVLFLHAGRARFGTPRIR